MLALHISAVGFLSRLVKLTFLVKFLLWEKAFLHIHGLSTSSQDIFKQFFFFLLTVLLWPKKTLSLEWESEDFFPCLYFVLVAMALGHFSSVK